MALFPNKLYSAVATDLGIADPLAKELQDQKNAQLKRAQGTGKLQSQSAVAEILQIAGGVNAS